MDVARPMALVISKVIEGRCLRVDSLICNICLLEFCIIVVVVVVVFFLMKNNKISHGKEYV